MEGLYENKVNFSLISIYHYFHIDHNAPSLPPPPLPKKMHNRCLQFLLGQLCYLGEIGNNGYAKFWG